MGRQTAISTELERMNRKIDKIGDAVKGVHGNTVPALSWIPSIVIAFLVIYPGQQIVMDTAREYKVSAWLSGWILDAKRITSEYALSSGIELAGGSVDYASPLKRTLEVTRSFSSIPKIHPVTGRKSVHNGTDYRCKVGDGVYAMRSGTVTHAADTGAAGNMIRITHSNGEESIYMHLNQMDVRKGEGVSTGENIGECGATGRVTGPHLHVEIRKAGGNPVDPIRLVNINSSADMWTYFKDTVAHSESRGDYTARTPSGSFNGRYQMGEDALKSIGLGHIAWDDFLKRPAMQELAYKKWQAKNLHVGRHGLNMTTKSGAKINLNGFITENTPAWKVAGYLHAAQFGATNALRWYTKGIDFEDGNGMRISEYAERGEVAFQAKYGRFASAKPLINTIER